MTAFQNAVLVSFIMSGLELLEVFAGLQLGIGQQWVEAVLIAATPPLVWVIPSIVAAMRR